MHRHAYWHAFLVGMGSAGVMLVSDTHNLWQLGITIAAMLIVFISDQTSP